MKNVLTALFCIGVFLASVPPAEAAGATLAERLKGYVLLQVEAYGEAWYVSPYEGLRYYMADGDAAYALMRSQGLGITNADLAMIPMVHDVGAISGETSVCVANPLAQRVKGYILLQVQAHGEAWYVDPDTCYRVYMANGNDAYATMRYLSLGITNRDLAQIPYHPDYVPDAEVSTANPFFGATLYLRSDTNAAIQVAAWERPRPADAVRLRRIAEQPTAVWFGDWNINVRHDVDAVVSAGAASGALPVLVAYNIPNRDCGGGYSPGGAASAAAYRAWITAFAEGIASRHAVVILEPDAAALNCFTADRAAMLADAVRTLKANAGTAVYIDAGHPDWTTAAVMAQRLTQSGIAGAEGFALNVSHFYTTGENIVFGNTLAGLLGGKHYVIDAGRNGNGRQGEWCNPLGAAIGVAPTATTGEALVDALLWIKPPGESDGTCNGGPSAGTWWAEYALRLVQNMP